MILFIVALLMALNLIAHGWLLTGLLLIYLAFRKTRNF